MKRLALSLLLCPIGYSFAVQTETVTHDSYADFNKGDPKGVAITDKGLRRLGRDVPHDVGFAHVDWSPQLGGMAGMDQNSELVGSAAVDLVVNQLHRGERGIPVHPKLVLIQSRWVEGNTVRGR